MSQQTFNDGEQRGSIRNKLNSNANDVEARFTNINTDIDLVTNTVNSVKQTADSNTNNLNNEVTNLNNEVTNLISGQELLQRNTSSYVSIADLEAALPAIDQEPRSLSRVTNDPDFGFVDAVCVDLGEGLRWLPYPRILDDSIRMGWGNARGFTAATFSNPPSDAVGIDVDITPAGLTSLAAQEISVLYPFVNMQVNITLVSDTTGSLSSLVTRLNTVGSIQHVVTVSDRDGAVARGTSTFELTHSNLTINIIASSTGAVSSSNSNIVFQNFSR